MRKIQKGMQEFHTAGTIYLLVCTFQDSKYQMHVKAVNRYRYYSHIYSYCFDKYYEDHTVEIVFPSCITKKRNLPLH